MRRTDVGESLLYGSHRDGTGLLPDAGRIRDWDMGVDTIHDRFSCLTRRENV